jgi:PAS domain S-box-containing protein
MGDFKDLEDLLQGVVDGVAEALPADQALLVTFDREARQIQQLVVGGPETFVEGLASFDELQESVLGWVTQEGRPFLSSQDRLVPGESSASLSKDDGNRVASRLPHVSEIGSMLVIPLVYQEEIFGTLAAFNRPDHADFVQRDLELLGAMSNHVATAIENVRLVGSLREQRDFAESLIETAQAIILLLDREGRIVRFNPYMEALSGYCLEEVQGQDWFTTFLPKRDQTRIRELFLRSIDGAQTQGTINCILTKDGEERYVEWYDKSLDDAEGRAVGLLAIGHDITERLRVEEALQDSEARYRTISELTSDYAYAFRVAADGTLALEWVTGAFTHITGYTLEEAQEPDLWATLIHTEDQEIAQARSRRLLEGHEDVCEFRIVTKQGEVRWLLDQARPIWSEAQGRVVRIIGAAQDITARRRAVLALEHQLEAARAFSSSLDYDEVMGHVALRLTEVAEVTRCTFLHWDVTARKVVVWMNYKCDDGRPEVGAEGARPETVYALEDLPVFQHILDRREPGVLRRAGGDVTLVEAERDYLRTFNTDAMLVLPLALADRVIGFVQLFNPGADRVFDATKTQIVEALANQAAVAIENVRLYEAVRQQRQQLRTLAARLSEAEEAERQWLAQELHDQVGQNMTALGVSLNIVRTLLPEAADVVATNLDVVRDRLDDAIETLGQTTERVRDVMADLRSPVLEDYGLVSALRWYGALFAARTGIEVVVEGEDPTPRLVVSAENALFRIAQEALTNIAKYAQATRAWITLSLEPRASHGWHTIRLIIADDGEGFDPARLEESGRRQGLGLVSMTERAETIGGTCRVEPAPEGGTQVVVEVQG